MLTGNNSYCEPFLENDITISAPTSTKTPTAIENKNRLSKNGNILE